VLNIFLPPRLPHSPHVIFGDILATPPPPPKILRII
jgi:hypothetical protein